MFYGTWIRVLDEKGRVAIPEDFVGEFGAKVVIMPDSNCILLYPEKGTDKFSDDEISQIRKVTIRGRVRVTIPIEFRNRVFQGCRKVRWEGRRDHFKIIPCDDI